MAGAIVWLILLWFLASYVFVGWDLLFWIACYFIPPLILWPIIQSVS